MEPYYEWIANRHHIQFERADLRNDVNYFRKHAVYVPLMDMHASSTIFSFDNYLRWRDQEVASNEKPNPP